MVEHEQDTDVLERHRARLVALEGQLASIQAEVAAERSVVQGLEALQLLQGDELAATVPDNGQVPEDFISARDAVMRVLTDDPGNYRVPQLAEAVARRNWTINSKNPAQAIRTALSRLEEAGDVVRRGYGLYGLPSPETGHSDPATGVG